MNLGACEKFPESSHGTAQIEYQGCRYQSNTNKKLAGCSLVTDLSLPYSLWGGNRVDNGFMADRSSKESISRPT